MAEERAQRRLAAILAADVVGYSRLMEQDEAGTLAALADRRKAILEPLLAKYRGRVVRLMGDGTLAEFASAVDAVQCAVDIRKAMKDANAKLPEDRAIVLRVGLNLGDVIVEDGGLYGDGVNVAARLEAMADPGGICLSAAIHQQVERLLPFAFRDLGDQALKNIARPARVYCVADDDAAGAPRAATPSGRTFSVQSRPSVAVLPFVNMSGDPEQEYFSDGITEDIITDLSKISALTVLSRNTTFTFKGKAVDIGQIAQRLKVGYVVEGSVRKVSGRVRITAQLIDASKDSHVWGERYDRDFNDIFALQDEIAQTIVAALKVRLLPAEKKAIQNRSTRNPEAYEMYLQGWHHFKHFSVNNLQMAIRFGQRALEIDPCYARAWALIARCQGALRRRGQLQESGLAAAEKALSLDLSLAEAHVAKGRVLSDLGRYDEAVAEYVEALRLDPDSSEARVAFGLTCKQFGDYQAAMEHFECASRLNEENYLVWGNLSQIYQALGREDERRHAASRALACIEKEVALHPDNPTMP
jgi:adenylate cyclase